MTKGKKKVKFDESVKTEDSGSYSGNAPSAKTKSRRFKENHSLDSDEEEPEDSNKEKKDNVLHEDDIEGQEEETIRFDEGISVTPFNLKEELEEGHFDAQGNYIANKDDEDATDQWLESVDWNKVANPQVKKRVKNTKDEKMEEDEKIQTPFQIKQAMLKLMKAGENVLRALRRLGGNKKAVSSADRWKKKKLGVEEPIDLKAEENKRDLLILTGLADDLLQQGDFQIYEKTHEQLSHEISKQLSQFEDAEDAADASASPTKKPKLDDNEKKIKDEEDESDDELEAAFINKDAESQDTSSDMKCETEDSGISEICWYYKSENTETTEQLGPFSSTIMLEMQEEGIFGDGGVFCRKVGSEGEFYTSKRIDFDLYI